MVKNVELYQKCLEIDDFNTIIERFFSEWEHKDCHRYFSWELCYKYFLENIGTNFGLKTNADILDKACLHLAFYLASWGMYRGSSNLLWKDYTIYRELIIKLICNYNNLFNDMNISEIIKAYSYISQYLNENNVSPTDTLITKILMGIFGCVPAYDRLFKDGLKKYNSKISQTFNRQSFEELQKIAKKITISKKLKNSNIQYPKMKLIDSCFWSVGYELEQDKKQREKSNKANHTKQ